MSLLASKFHMWTKFGVDLSNGGTCIAAHTDRQTDKHTNRQTNILFLEKTNVQRGKQDLRRSQRYDINCTHTSSITYTIVQMGCRVSLCGGLSTSMVPSHFSSIYWIRIVGLILKPVDWKMCLLPMTFCLVQILTQIIMSSLTSTTC